MSDVRANTPQAEHEKIADAIRVQRDECLSRFDQIRTLINESPSVGGNTVVVNRDVLLERIRVAYDAVQSDLSWASSAVRNRLTERPAALANDETPR